MAETPYRIFDATLLSKRMLSPHMARLTFGGEQIRDMTTLAPDQRIKLFFPHADGTPPTIPNQPGWYDLYRAVPVAERAPMRTYTIRSLDADRGELDVDFVLHGETGPASRWALNAKPGDAIQISAPNRRFDGEIGGFDWEPPADVANVLLIADETALPAVAGILEQITTWKKRPAAEAFIEIPAAADRLDLPTWPGLQLHWIVRDEADAAYGAGMIGSAEQAAIPHSVLGVDRAELADVDIENDTLWDRAEANASDFYGWVAGETAAVSRIRTLLIKEKAIDRTRLTLMGYWRYGKAHS